MQDTIPQKKTPPEGDDSPRPSTTEPGQTSTSHRLSNAPVRGSSSPPRVITSTSKPLPARPSMRTPFSSQAQKVDPDPFDSERPSYSGHPLPRAQSQTPSSPSRPPPLPPRVSATTPPPRSESSGQLEAAKVDIQGRPFRPIAPAPPSARPPLVRASQAPGSGVSSSSTLPPPTRTFPSAPPLVRRPTHDATAVDPPAVRGSDRGDENKVLQVELDNLKTRLSAQRQIARIAHGDLERLRNELAILKANAPTDSAKEAMEKERTRHREVVKALEIKHATELSTLRNRLTQSTIEESRLQTEQIAELESSLVNLRQENSQLTERLLSVQKTTEKEVPGQEKIDDLTRIQGVGPAFAKGLRLQGITTFGEIANWTPEEIEKLAPKLKSTLPRMQKWVRSARELVQQN